MTIKPLVINGTIQRVQDMGNIKQQEDVKPVVDQHNIQNAVVKEERRRATQVVAPEKTEQEDFRYDAKEEGQTGYQQKKGNKKKKETVKEKGKVIVKGNTGFDIKV